MYLVSSKGLGGALAAEAHIRIDQAHEGMFPNWIHYLLQVGDIFLGFLVDPLNPGDEIHSLTDFLGQLFLTVAKKLFLWTKLLQRLLSSVFLFDSLEPLARKFTLGADALSAPF